MKDRAVHVLLIEDDKGCAEAIRRAFQCHAVPVSLTVAATLHQARTCLADSSPELVIAELSLPDGKGTDILSGSDQAARFHLVVLAERDSERAAVKAIGAGARDYVIKSEASLADLPRVALRAVGDWEHGTQRERAEAALRESERRFRAIFDQTFQFIGLMSVDGTLIEANRAALGFAGIKQSDVLGKPFWETPWWAHSTEMQDRLREAIRRAAAGHLVRFEATHLAADGTLNYVDFSLKPVKDEAGNVTLLIPEGREITERKQFEEALQKEQQLLKQLLDLRERERKLVSHEIHDGLAQQLTGAIMQFQAFRQLQDHDTDKARSVFDEALEMLQDGLSQARRLISGLRPPILDDLGVVSAIEYLIAEQQKRGRQRIKFRHDVSFDRLAPPLEDAVFRIVQEALNNACRHSRSKKIRVELAERHGHVCIEVRDWGVGFKPDKIKEGRFGVKGIRERARLMGGQFDVETAPDKGTRIRVELPLVETDLPQP